jgi:hypothetical protein
MALISFLPQEADIQFYQGNTVLLICTATDANNNPINMTGGTIASKIRAQDTNSSTVLATFVVTWVSQTTGQFNLSLTAAITDAFNWQGTAYYDITFNDGNTPANVYTLAWGQVTLQNSVSY